MKDMDEKLSDDALEFAQQLFDAARKGDIPFVVGAVDQGVSVDLTDESGNTFTMLAAYHGQADLVEQLASRGADLNRLNDRGQSPLAGAVFKRFDEVIAVLLALGADVDEGTPSARDTAQVFGVTLPA